MPLFWENHSSSAFIGIWKISEDIEEMVSMADGKKIDLKVIEGLKNRQRMLEVMAVKLLLFHFFGYEPKLDHTAQGKPLLTDEPYFISISHTKGYAALYLHHQQEIGIDIEYFCDRVKRVAQRFLHSDELAFIDKDQTTAHLLVCWSAKESIFKTINQSNVEFSQDIILHPFNIESQGEIMVTDQTLSSPVIHKIVYFHNKEFVLTYTVV